MGLAEDEVVKFFQKEIDTLKIMRDLGHKHLIEAIFAYNQGLERYIVFPWAQGGNLRQFWRRNPGPSTREDVLWAWKQIQGLSDGLSALHGKDTRHGDLKPENILSFGIAGEPESGNLVIADVGIAKFHADETAIRQAEGKPTTNKYGTLRYAPPKTEIGTSKTGGQISRRYDSWSLGCILLEFIIWLWHGNNGLSEFENERHDEIQPIKTSSFWVEPHNGRPILHPVVRRWTKEELPERHKRKSALRDLLEIVALELLVIDVDSRRYVSEFCKSLRQIQNKCAENPAYLWNGPANQVTPSRKATAKDAEGEEPHPEREFSRVCSITATESSPAKSTS